MVSHQAHPRGRSERDSGADHAMPESRLVDLEDGSLDPNELTGEPDWEDEDSDDET